MLRRILGRRRRAAAELFGVLALAALAGMALTAWTLTQTREQTFAARMTAGHTAATWLQATHRATQEDDWTAIAAAGGSVVTPATLVADGHAPPGLPAVQRGMTMTLGVISDGSPDDVPMAFIVIDPDSPARAAGIHAGLIEAGIAGIEHAAGPPGTMALHRPAIEAIAGSLDAAAFFVTADTLAYHPAALYRRPQPGRPRLNHMETDLALADNDVLNAAALHAGAIDHLDPLIDVTDPTTWPGVTTLSTTDISQVAVVVDPNSLIPGTTIIDPMAPSIEPGAATLDAATAVFTAFEGARIAGAAGLTVTADLVVGTLITPSQLQAASATIAGDLQAAALRGSTASAQETAIAGAAAVTGTLATSSASAGTVSGAPRASTTTLRATGGIYGPALTITGRLTTSSCDGC